MGKRKRFLLLVAIFLSLGGVAYKVTTSIWAMKAREFKTNPIKALEYIPESALHLKDFHRAKIEEGRKVWEIFGDEANYFKEQKEAVIKKPRFLYYDRQGEIAETTGEVARIYLNEKELEKMQLQGGIRVSYQGYVLESEEAIYIPADQKILMPSKTTVMTTGIHLEGATMEVELEEQKVRLLKEVKTRIDPDKLTGRKKKTELAARANGG